MSRDLRMLQAGADESERFDSLTDLRARGTFAGTYSSVMGRHHPVLRLTSNGAEYLQTGASWTPEGLGDLTLMVSFRSDSRGDIPLMAWGAAGACWHISLSIGVPGTISCGIMDSATNTAITVGTTSGKTGIWYDVAMVLNRTEQRLHLYVNGIEEGVAANTAGVGAIIPPTDIGFNAWHGTALGGTYLDVADALHFPRALTASEVLAVHNRSVWDYDRPTHRYDMSEINPQDMTRVATAVNGTGTDIAAADIVTGPFGGLATDYDGATEKTTMGNVGTVRTVCALVRPATTTEELILLSTGNDIMVSGGTVTYAGVTASATYVDGVASTTMVANAWQHLICVLSADHAASAFAVATDGTNFGAVIVGDVRTYSVALSAIQARDLYERLRRGVA